MVVRVIVLLKQTNTIFKIQSQSSIEASSPFANIDLGAINVKDIFFKVYTSTFKDNFYMYETSPLIELLWVF